MSALGIKTHFSTSVSTLKPKALAKSAAELEYTAIALCDNMTMAGMTEFVAACKENELDYAIGTALNFFETSTEKEKAKPYCTLKFFAKNEQGIKDLFSLLSVAFQRDHFYYVPRLSVADIRGLDLRNVVVTTGDIDNLFASTSKTAKTLWQAILAAGASTLVETIAVNQPYYTRTNTLAKSYADSKSVETIVTRPALYLQGQADVRDIAQAVTTNSDPNHPLAPKPTERELHLMSADDIADIADDLGLDKPNDDTLFSLCTYKWEKQPMSLPKLAPDEFAALVSLCKAGWAERVKSKVFGETLTGATLAEYKDRLKYELSIINKMGFSAYFLLVHYVVNYAKDNDIFVGPARGSAAGSLVAYLLKITDVDPLRFGLIFERFLNPERLDYPDIDLDFMSSRRAEIIEHLIAKFGAENVSGIANYNSLGSASSLRDVARVSKLPSADYECSKLVPKEHGASVDLEEAVKAVTAIEEFSLKYPRQWKQSLALQGTIRSMGQHAAGIVVAGEPILNRGVVMNNKEYPVVCWDKRVVEDWGLIKLDVLGLSTLDIIKLAVEKVKQTSGTTLDLLQIPLDDAETLKVFAEGRTKGVFQFEGGMARNLCREIAVSGDFHFNDIVAVNALNRPGPLEAGLTDKYVKIRQGRFSPEYPHPKTEDALGETESVIVYQEQVMKIARDLCGFTMAEADTLRKAIGKKSADLMKTMEEKFVTGAMANSMLEMDARFLWSQIEGFAAYSFNKSHAVAYSLISYQAAYLKAHHAGAFYAASMSVLDDEKVKLIAKEATTDGYIVMPPDINHSSDSFEIVYDPARMKSVLYSPLTAVKNVSAKVCAHILEKRREKATGFESYEDFAASVVARNCNKRAKENLDKVGAFASIESAQIHALHADRLRDQKELMGALAVADVKPDRHIDISPLLMKRIQDLYDDMSGNGLIPIQPTHGKKPKFVVVTDKPTFFEVQEGASFKGKSTSYFKQALKDAGLKPSEGYYTHLVKTQPSDKKALTKEEIAYYGKYLKEELKLLDPPLVILAGTQSIRYLFPDVKGSAEDLSRTVEYDKEHDRNYMMCINPQMIYIKPEKQELLNQVFNDVAELFDVA